MNSHQGLFGGNIPQDVTGKQGENAIFIVYGLKQSNNTIKQVKDLCANFSALIRSMRNRFPEMQFSCTIGLPKTAKNLALIECAHLPSSISRYPYLKHKGTLLRNGIEMIKNAGGLAILAHPVYITEDYDKLYSLLKQLKELNILRFQPPVIFFYTSGQNRWDSALSLPPLSTKS